MVLVIMSKNNSDTQVFKNIAKISIPKQLRDFPGARFILINKFEGKGKRPKERKWTTDKNYHANDPKLLGHIRGGGNYGIATGIAGLCCFDADEFDRLVELGVINKLPKTLTIRTGRTSSEGRHYWYHIKGLSKRLVFYDQELRDPKNENEHLHLGEVQSRGNYAIGPNCIHKSGKQYEIIDDSTIADITYEQLIEILKPLRLKKKDDRPADVKYERNLSCQHSHQEVDIDKIGWPTGNIIKEQTSRGTEFKGSHPFHASTSGTNFSINPSKGVWHCWKHDTGGGWVELLAVKEGIIHCGQAGKNCLSRSQRREVMQKAEDLGLIEEQVLDVPEKEILLEREAVVEIPKNVPDGKVVLLVAPPRTGKSHKVIEWLNRNGSGNYITHNHAIVEHVIKIAKELRMQKVVWLIGMHQPGACIFSGSDRSCATCPLKHGKENHFEYEREATKLLKEKEILTARDVPNNYCPYYILKAAEKHARYCFTVVNNINTIIPRDFVVLDEEPVLSHFYATSIEVATIKTRMGESSTKNFIEKSKQLSFELDQILNHRKKPNLHEYATKIQEISTIINNGIDEGYAAGDIAEEIEDALITFDPKHREVREEGQDEGEELGMEQMIRCLGHLYKESPVTVMKKRGGYSSIYILGDERATSYGMAWFNAVKKLVVIGATKAEIFVKELNGREIIIEDFRYNDRFMLIGVDKSKIGDNRGSRNAQKKKVLDIAKALWKSPEGNERTPFLILTGSKREQESVTAMLGGASNIRGERENGMEWEMANGKPIVIYQNSIISRGLDVDQFGLMLVYGCNFAQPFWSVADPGIAAAIISDETTNSVLRISSTLRSDAKTMKLVIMQKDDLRKVKYLSNIRVSSEEPDTLARVIKTLGVAGKVRKEGRTSVKVEKTGIDSEFGKEKIIELISRTDELVDDDEKLSVMARIIALMKQEKRNSKKLVSSGKIYSEIKTRGGENLVRSALQELYANGRVLLRSHGKAKKWELNVTRKE